jgi:glycosyltransferase involved in cell wall biosynthesis
MVVPSLRGGGLERLARDLVMALQDQGLEPAVFCIAGVGLYADELRARGIAVHDCTERRLRLRGVPLRLLRALAGFRPDIIHAHTGTWYAAAVARTLLRSPRLVFTDHGRYPPEPRARALVERWCYGRTDRFLAVSPALATYVQEFLHLPAPPEVAENGVDLEPFQDAAGARARLRAEWQLGEQDVLALAVGRFAPVKDHAGLLDAFARAAGRAPALRLAFAGTGALEAALRARAGELGVAEQVRFLGFRTDVAACLRATDLFVISSTTEGLPVSLLEAMAAGLPVVSTAVGGIPDALGEPPGGILVPPGDPERLADALASAALDPELRARLGARSLQNVQRFSLSAFVRRYSELYTTLLRRSGA